MINLTDASKVALYSLSQQLLHWRFKLIDCQVYSEHLASLGAVTIERQQFTSLLEQHIDEPSLSLWNSTRE